MKTLFICLTIVAAFGSILAKEYWQCDAAGQFKCTLQQTCCRSRVNPNGWACFPAVRGTCCSDGLSCCPENNICNTVEKKCVPKALVFLGDLESPVMSSPLESVPIKEALEFLEGLNQGFGIFANLTHSGSCQPSEEMVQDVNSLVNYIRDFDWTSGNYFELISTVYIKVTGVYQKAKELVGPCQELSKEIDGVLKEIGAYLSDPNFPTQLLFHSLQHLNDFKSAFSKGETDFVNGQFLSAGQDFGALVKDVIFFNFKQTTFTDVDMQSVLNDKMYSGVVDCLRAVARDATSIVKDVETLVEAIKTEDLAKIAAVATDLLGVASDLIKNCQNVF